MYISADLLGRESAGLEGSCFAQPAVRRTQHCRQRLQGWERVSVREKERVKVREKERERERERERDRQRERQRERKSVCERETQRAREGERECERVKVLLQEFPAHRFTESLSSSSSVLLSSLESSGTHSLSTGSSILDSNRARCCRPTFPPDSWPTHSRVRG